MRFANVRLAIMDVKSLLWDPIQMSLALIILIALAVLWFAERSLEHLTLAAAALCFVHRNAAVCRCDLERAILLSSIVAAAQFSEHRESKYNHSGIKLIATHLPLAFAGTVPFLLVQYPFALTAALVGSITLMLAAVATVIYVRGPPVPFELQILFFGVTCIGLMAAYKASGGPVPFQRNAALRRCFLSSFIASLLNPLSWRPSGGLALSDIAEDPLPLMAAVPARSLDYPDIIVIQHESIFDPRLFGLPVEPIVELFLSPKDDLMAA